MDYIRATLETRDGCTVATPFPIQDFLDAGAAGKGGLPGHARALCPGRAGREPVFHH